MDVVLKANLTQSAAYSISKAAVNMVVAKYAAQLKPEGFVVLELSPGFVDASATAVAARKSRRSVFKRKRNVELDLQRHLQRRSMR